jgi:hypothetical protein
MKNLYVVFVVLGFTNSIHAQSFIWGKGWGGTMSDKANAIVVDDSANVYVTGKFSGTADFDPSPNTANLISAGQGDIFVAKYNKSGTYQWAFRIGNVIDDEGNFIALDANGDLLVTGNFQGPADFDPSVNTATLTPGAYNDVFIAKYTRNGAYKWAKNIYGAGYDYGYCIASGHHNKIYVSGRYNKTADFDPSANTVNLSSSNNSIDIFIACYDADGNYNWAKSIGGPSTELSSSFKLDKDDNIYLCGYYSDSTNLNPAGTLPFMSKGQNDFFIANYDSLGLLKWGKSMGAKGDDYANTLTIDPASNIYIAGRFSDTVDFNPGPTSNTAISYGSADGFLAAYDASGNYKWVRTVGNASYDNMISAATNKKGHTYVTGSYNGTVDFDPKSTHTSLTSKGDDVYVCKYDQNGKFIWVKGIGDVNTQTSKFIDLDTANNIYLTGSFYTSILFEGSPINAAGQEDVFLAKYADPFVITDMKTHPDAGEKISLYPNPSSGVFAVSLPDVPDEHAIIAIYNLLGKVCIQKQPGPDHILSVDMAAFPDGIYLLEYRSGTQRITRKIVKY